MRKEGFNNTDCHGELAPGQRCVTCGAYRHTAAESARLLEEDHQPPYDQFVSRFAGNDKELTAMIDLRFRVNYPIWDQTRTDEMVRRIKNGELPSKLVLET